MSTVTGTHDTRKVARFGRVTLEQFKDDMVHAQDHFTDSEIEEMYDNLKLPKRATVGSAGYDFYAPFDFILAPNHSIKFPTGINCEMLDGWFLAVVPRSGLGFKYKVQLDNTIGIIDADYIRAENGGDIHCKFTNNGNKTVSIKAADAFMQGILLPFGLTFDDDADGVRTGGMGSTDKGVGV